VEVKCNEARADAKCVSDFARSFARAQQKDDLLAAGRKVFEARASRGEADSVAGLRDTGG